MKSSSHLCAPKYAETAIPSDLGQTALSVDANRPYKYCQCPWHRLGRLIYIINHWWESFSFQSSFGKRWQPEILRTGVESWMWMSGFWEHTWGLGCWSFCVIGLGTIHSKSVEPSLFLPHPPRSNWEKLHILRFSIFIYYGWLWQRSFILFF